MKQSGIIFVNMKCHLIVNNTINGVAKIKFFKVNKL